MTPRFLTWTICEDSDIMGYALNGYTHHFFYVSCLYAVSKNASIPLFPIFLISIAEASDISMAFEMAWLDCLAICGLPEMFSFDLKHLISTMCISQGCWFFIYIINVQQAYAYKYESWNNSQLAKSEVFALAPHSLAFFFLWLCFIFPFKCLNLSSFPKLSSYCNELF